MAVMGSISGAIGKFIDQLPAWAKLICVVLAIVGSVYYIARNGFLSFLLHLIFSP
jgi:hypothetical protein